MKNGEVTKYHHTKGKIFETSKIEKKNEQKQNSI